MNANSYDYSGQIAVITGGCNGIGAAVAERLVMSNAKVALWDIDVSDPEARILRLGEGDCHIQSVDICNLESVESAVAETEATLGKIDVLVNSAGIAGPNVSLTEYPVDMWRMVQTVNVDGTFNCCKAVVPGMVRRNYGRIVNIASVAGKEGNPNASAYSASKAAVIALTKSLGKELSGNDIGVNCVTPAAARTRIFDQMSQAHIDYMLAKIPRGRFVKVEEIASMIAWVASAENSFTTGAVFDLSGGRATY